MPQITIAPNYRPHDHQRRLHRSPARFVSAVAGVRGGKTFSMAVEFARRIARDAATPGKGNTVSGFGKRRRPRLHYWVVAPTADLLREPLRYLFEVLPSEWIENWWESEKQLWLKGDILIELKTAERPRSLVASGLHGLWIDEAARLKPETWKGQLRQRLSDKAGWALFSTTPLGKNWFYDEVALRGMEGASHDEQFECVQWRTIDNPVIPAEEVEAAKRQLPLRWYQREYEASFSAFTGTIFDEWDEARHVVSEAQLRLEYGLGAHRELRSIFRRVVAGQDWGWNSPGALLVLGDTGREVIVLDESYAPNRIVFDPRLDSGTWVTEAHRFRLAWGVNTFACDPSKPEAIYDMQRASLPAQGANNEVTYGVRKVAELMHPVAGKPRLRILDRCVNLRREIPLYQWAQSRSGEMLLDVPADGQSDHAIDALRYGVVELRQHESARTADTSRPRYGGGPIG